MLITGEVNSTLKWELPNVIYIQHYYVVQKCGQWRSKHILKIEVTKCRYSEEYVIFYENENNEIHKFLKNWWKKWKRYKLFQPH